MTELLVEFSSSAYLTDTLLSRFTRIPALGQGFEFLLVIGQLLLQHGKLLNELPEHLLAQGRQFGLFGLELADDCLAKLRHSLGDHNAIFVQQPMYLIQVVFQTWI
jgi:hypothetical protein